MLAPGQIVMYKKTVARIKKILCCPKGELKFIVEFGNKTAVCHKNELKELN